MSRKAREIPWLDTRDGTYYVFWYNREAGRTDRMSLRTSDPEEAKASYVTFLSEGKAMYEDRHSDLTVARALDDYEKEHVDLKCADSQRQREILAHLRTFFGDSLMRSIDIPACRRYAAARRSGEIKGKHVGKGASDSTICREMRALRAAAGHALRWKRLTMAEMPSIEYPAERSKEAEWYTHDELTFLLWTATGELRDFMTVLYWTGARRGAIEALQRVQVDFANERINLLTPGKEQTKKRMPIVPLFDQIRDTMEQLSKGKKPQEQLFGGRNFYDPYRDHCDGAGLAHKGNPHVMRHTRATHMLQSGVSIYDVARLLGDTVGTIESTYGHHSSEYLKSTTGGTNA